MSVNLIELYEKGIVKDGAHNVNVPILKSNGERYIGKTYMIPLEYLFYNEHNGRIGVAVSEHEANGGEITPGHNEEYNKIIQDILKDGGDDKTKSDMKILKRDIALKGQQEPGFVLINGRVIDGNRRFTAKRLLEQDRTISESQYFEAVILDDLSVQNITDRKKIKSLELQIQFGKLGKVDYNPIDRAIDAYKTVVVNKIMTAKDYSQYAGITSNEVNKRILETELIVKFLTFCNSNPDNYALAKQLDLDGPLQDLIPQYKKFKNETNAQQLLNSLFTKIIQIRSSKEDYKHEYRQLLKSVIGTPEEEKFIEDMEDSTDTIVDSMDSEVPIKNHIELITRLNENEDNIYALSNVQKITTEYSESVKNQKEKNEPIKLVDKALTSLKSIDIAIINKLSNTEKKSLYSTLGKLKNVVNSIEATEE